MAARWKTASAFSEEARDQRTISDVACHELDPWPVGQVRILQRVTAQVIEQHQVGLAREPLGEVGPDKTRTACNDVSRSHVCYHNRWVRGVRA